MTITMGAGLPVTVDPPASAGGDPLLRSEVKQARLHAIAEPLSEQEASRLTTLLRAHYSRVWRTVRRLGVDGASVDDAAQEVFIVLSRRMAEVREGCEQTFLLSSAVRIAANYRRSRLAQREVLDEQVLAGERDPQPSADQLLDHKRVRQALDEVLDGWPEDIRTVFVLFELEGLSVPEISRITEAKLGTVASRLRRARELFRAGAKRLRARSAGGGEL